MDSVSVFLTHLSPRKTGMAQRAETCRAGVSSQNIPPLGLHALAISSNYHQREKLLNCNVSNKRNLHKVQFKDVLSLQCCQMRNPSVFRQIKSENLALGNALHLTLSPLGLYCKALWRTQA